MLSDEQPIEAEVVAPRTVSRVYSAPRRFDISTIMVVTIAYALLLSAMRLLQFEPIYQAAVAGYISGVGVGQALLFRGKNPRAASILIGAIGLIGIVGGAAVSGGNGLGAYLFFSALCLAPFGAFLGYIAGVAVGAVFMIAEALRNVLGSRSVQ